MGKHVNSRVTTVTVFAKMIIEGSYTEFLRDLQQSVSQSVGRSVDQPVFRPFLSLKFHERVVGVSMFSAIDRHSWNSLLINKSIKEQNDHICD